MRIRLRRPVYPGAEYATLFFGVFTVGLGRHFYHGAVQAAPPG
ncbi:hypothetical protein [Nocardia sp. NPDC004260]